MMKICPACGAEAPNDALECCYCGSKIVPVSLPAEQRKEAMQIIHSLNESMLEEKKRLLRQTDLVSIGFWMAGIVVILIAGFVLHSNNIHLGMLLFSAVNLFIWRSFKQKRAFSGVISFFQQRVNPKINEVSDRLGLPRWQFDQMAARELSENDLLRKFMFFRSEPHAD